MNEPVTETSSSTFETIEAVMYVHVETQRERLQRMSNRCADAFAQCAEDDGEFLKHIAEMADVLWQLSGVADIIEHLGEFGR